MSDAALIIPHVLTAVAVFAAALCGWPAVNRRLNVTQASWLLALLPLAAFVFFLSQLTAISSGTPLTFSADWMPSLGAMVTLYFDNVSALFLLLVTGIGTLVIIYMNNKGTGLLVRLEAQARGAGRRLVASGLNDHYRRIFRVTGLDEGIPVFSDVAQAVAAQ